MTISQNSYRASDYVLPPLSDYTGVEPGEVTFDRALADLLPAQIAGLQSTSRYVAGEGGFGSGKTVWLCLAAIMEGMSQPQGYSLISRLNAPALRTTTMKTFLELMPLGWVRKWVPTADPPLLIAVNGHEFRFGHLDITSPEQRGWVRSLNLSAFYIDQGEEIPESTFHLLMPRLRRQGVSMWAGRVVANPNGQDWIWRLFYDANRHFKQKQLFEGLIFPTHENRHLRPGYVEELECVFPEDWKARFIRGEFADFTDKVYKDFNGNVHCFDCDQEWAVFANRDGQPSGHPPRHWPVIVGIDVGGGVDPWGLVFVAVDPETGNLYQFGEIHGKGILTREIADRYFQIIEDRPLEGAAYDWENQQVGLELNGEGIPCTRANKDVLAGTFKVAQYLHPDPRLVSPFTGNKGAPRYYVCRNCCPSTVRSLAGLSYDKNRQGLPTGDIKHDEHSHDAAALRYAIHSFRPEPRNMKIVIDEFKGLDPLSRQYWMDVARMKARGYTDPHERYPEKPRRRSQFTKKVFLP